MIIEFSKKNNFYDDLRNKLYDVEFKEKIYYNFIPIKIHGVNYLLTSSKNLEGYFMDYNKNVKVKLYIKNTNDDIECIKFKLSNIVVFGQDFNQHSNNNVEQPDCYIDLHCDLLLIKFNSSKLDFIIIHDNLNYEKDLRHLEEIIDLKYIWMNKNFEIKNKNNIGKIINVWNDKYINLPPIPLMINIENTELESELTKPITGSPVFDKNDNFLGMVTYVNPEQITITPLISIKKMCDNLFDYKMLYLPVDLEPIKINLKSGLNNINYTNGLLVTNDYYDNLLSYEKKINREIKKIKNENNIDDCSINIYNIPDELKILYEKKKSLQITKDFLNLRKGTIICSIDNHEINTQGNVIIYDNENLLSEEKKYKIIPFKSYIWIFKNSRNNQINLRNISPKNYVGDLINSQNNELIINDSCIKKQVNIFESLIILNMTYNDVSLFSLDKIKYVTYNTKTNFIKLIELNEKTLEIMKHFFAKNNRKYTDIIHYIFNYKYSYNGKKTLLILNFNERKLPTINIISSNINNYNDLLEKYKTNEELKSFLISQRLLHQKQNL